MIRVYKEDLYKVGQIYVDKLNEKFSNVLMTPNTVERMKIMLEGVRRQMGQGETNPVWDVKFEIRVLSPGRFELTPDLEDVNVVSRDPFNNKE